MTMVMLSVTLSIEIPLCFQYLLLFSIPAKNLLLFYVREYELRRRIEDLVSIMYMCVNCEYQGFHFGFPDEYAY